MKRGLIMDKYVIRFLTEKVLAIAIFLVGIHLLVTRIQNELPFGIVSDDIALWGVWAYFGFPIAFIVIAGGAYLFTKEFIERWIRKNLE